MTTLTLLLLALSALLVAMHGDGERAVEPVAEGSANIPNFRFEDWRQLTD